MSKLEYKKLCETTEIGTAVSFQYNDKQITGTFIGCAENAMIIEANGKNFIWPWQLCDYRKSSYPIPTYF